MARRKQPVAIRHDLQRLFVRGVLLCAAGVFAGWALGEMVAVDRTDTIPAGLSSFSELSANPEAHAGSPEGDSSPCLDCADSYGATMRLRAARAERMDGAVRALGAVDQTETVDPPDDGYRYGGRFPDAASPDVHRQGTTRAESPLPNTRIEAPRDAPPPTPDTD